MVSQDNYRINESCRADDAIPYHVYTCLKGGGLIDCRILHGTCIVC